MVLLNTPGSIYEIDARHLPWDRIRKVREFIEDEHRGEWYLVDGASMIDGVYECHTTFVLHDPTDFVLVSVRLMV